MEERLGESKYSFSCSGDSRGKGFIELYCLGENFWFI